MSKDVLGAAVQKLVELPPERWSIAHDFLTKLGGGETEVEECKRYLRKEYPWAFPTALMIGTPLRTADDFLVALIAAGCKVSDNIREMFRQPEFVVADQKIELELVVRSAKELGSARCVNWLTDVYQLAREQGLELCPPEVGPRVRLAYDQSMVNKNKPREMILVGMEPINNSSGEPCIWDITMDMDYTPCLYGLHIDTEHPFSSDQRFIFCRRKSAKRRGR